MLEEMVASWPRDMLAVKLLNDRYFWAGRLADIRTLFDRIMPSNDDEPLLLGYYAFACGETGDIAQAERLAAEVSCSVLHAAPFRRRLSRPPDGRRDDRARAASGATRGPITPLRTSTSTRGAPRKACATSRHSHHSGTRAAPMWRAIATGTWR